MEQYVGLAVAALTSLAALFGVLKVLIAWVEKQQDKHDLTLVKQQEYLANQFAASATERKEITERFLTSLDLRAEHDREADEMVAAGLSELAALCRTAFANSEKEHAALMEGLAALTKRGVFPTTS